jgi:hypothetical protein
MFRNLRNKKGEMTTQQIVMLVILIVSFIIILIFIFLLNSKDLTDKEICRNSVILKDKTGSIAEGVNCRTSYTCISSGGECGNFNPSDTIEITTDNREEVMNAVASELAECWWMFGEGKADYAGKTIGLDNTDTICAICSIVSFDDDVKKLGPISYLELYNHLATSKDGTQTYLKYLYNTDSVDTFQDNLQGNYQGYLGNSLDLNKQYFILTGMTKETGNFFGLFGEDYVPVTILEKTEANYDKIGCDEFITRA